MFWFQLCSAIGFREQVFDLYWGITVIFIEVVFCWRLSLPVYYPKKILMENSVFQLELSRSLFGITSCMCFGAKHFQYFLPLKKISINYLICWPQPLPPFFFPIPKTSLLKGACSLHIPLNQDWFQLLLTGLSPLAVVMAFLCVCPVIRPIWTHY